MVPGQEYVVACGEENEIRKELVRWWGPQRTRIERLRRRMLDTRSPAGSLEPGSSLVAWDQVLLSADLSSSPMGD
jgi:hypothetical protein